ncbi:MAG: Arc family DNA-binding protein [Rubrivivax sp.]
MAVNLSIKEVPDDLAERLRARAARNHRSLQGELMAIVEQAAAEAAGAPAAPDVYRTAVFVQRGTKTIEQIAAEARQRFPQPIQRGPLAVDIIRADRDSR